MAERFVLATAILALLPAFGGSRTAWALLASYAYAWFVGDYLQVPFWAPEWVMADLFVMRVILSPNAGLAEDLIAALMIPAWIGYALGQHLNYDIGMGVVALQFLLCLPVRKWQRIIFSVSHGPLRRTAHEGR